MSTESDALLSLGRRAVACKAWVRALELAPG
jgi:hypothetical protein